MHLTKMGEKMKTVRIMLVLLGLYVSNVAYGVKLPEYDGLYAVDGNKLIEIDHHNVNFDLPPGVQFTPDTRPMHLSYELPSNVQFIGVAFGYIKLYPVRFVRGLTMDGRISTRNYFSSMGYGMVDIKTKSVQGKLNTVFFVPRAPLATGIYEFAAVNNTTGAVIYIPNKKEVYKSTAWCVDEVWNKGEQTFIPCSDSPTTTSASNATPSSATGTGTNTGALGKASGAQQMAAPNELSRFIDSPAVSGDEERRFVREEAARAARLNSLPNLLRLKQSRRNALKRNDYQGIIDPSLQILQIDPADYESLDYLANLYTAVNNPDKALVYAAECLKRVVRPRTFALITQAYLMKKDKKNTLLWLEKTLQSKYPHHPAEADLNQAFPKDQGEISSIFNKYRATSGTSMVSSGLAQNQPGAAQNAQSQPNVVEGVASVFKSIIGGVTSALPKQGAVAAPSQTGQAVTGAPQAPTSPSVSAPPPGKATVTGWEAVVPGGKLGEFGHGTKVSKTKKGELVLASSNNPMTHTHPGIDILAECGSPIYPVADGEVFDVINSKDDGDYGEDGKKGLGYMTIVKHDVPTNTYSLYLHMQEEPSVKPGDKVVAGKTILGKIGKTGAAWGCHTHFEVRLFGTRYLTDKGWNYPANIYGKGEQAERLAKNWEDPLAIGAR